MHPKGCGFQPPIVFSLGKENGPLTVQKKSAFAVFGDTRPPKTLSAGVVFADDKVDIEGLYCTAGNW